MGITFPDKKTPSEAVHEWMMTSPTGKQVIEVDERWPHSATCWDGGDHGFC
jgi:hypothetical protein